MDSPVVSVRYTHGLEFAERLCRMACKMAQRKSRRFVPFENKYKA